jgi:arsenite-transporting ATPase
MTAWQNTPGSFESLEKRCGQNRATKILFGGKGGVGKTTTAAAAALYWASKNRTLIVSTDPAHSLSDIFEQPIGGKETAVADNLVAVEIDPEQAIRAYKEKILKQYGATLREFELDLEAYVNTLEHNPGAYESAIFDEFSRHLLRQDYATVVFDTAPTGSTLRLIFMPEYLDAWIRFLIQSRKGILKLREMLTREKDPVIETLYTMQKQFTQIGTLLKSNQAAFFLVLNPETLAYEETARTIKMLTYYKVRPAGLIVNRVVNEAFPYAGYVASQKRILDKIEKNFAQIKKTNIPFLGEEVRGVKRLKRLISFVQPLFE